MPKLNDGDHEIEEDLQLDDLRRILINWIGTAYNTNK